MASLISSWGLAILLPLVGAVALPSAPSTQNAGSFTPVGYAVGTKPNLQTAPFAPFTLSPSSPLVTLDYGREVAGLPYFQVESVTGQVQIEVKYSEQFPALSANFSDGPYMYVVTLSNGFRVETFNITGPGTLSAPLIQGGQKWETIRLLTKGTVSFSSVGFVPSIATTQVSQFPGSFSSNDAFYNNVWDLGARAANAACLANGTQGATWNVSSKGVYATAQKAGQSNIANSWTNYTLAFNTTIVRGGSGWVVANTLNAEQYGINLNLVGNYPPETTFVNVNKTLLPPNSIVVAYGYTLVNQTTLPSYTIGTFPVPFTVHENTEYRITTILSGPSNISVLVDGTKVFAIDLADYYYGTGPIDTTITTGTWGFGPYQDQIAWYRDVKVTSTHNGSTLYTNSLTDSPSVLREYGTGANYHSACLDGAKRDRLVWMGDFSVTSRIVSASTGAFDKLKGTLQYYVDWQADDGTFVIDPPMGYSPNEADSFVTFYDGLLGLPDYQILGLQAFSTYVRATNDIAFAKSTWAAWKRQIAFLTSNINSTTGLLDLIGLGFIGPTTSGSATSCALVQALNGAAEIATAIGDNAAAANYTKYATAMAAGINSLLWSAETGTYAYELGLPANYSTAGIAFCISSGVSNATRTAATLKLLPNLKLGPGYKDTNAVSNTDPTVNISPFTNGYLLQALLIAGAQTASAATTAKDLIQTLWGAMQSNASYYTGSSWEYVNAATSEPGLSYFTSLNHPWGGAATYALTEYVAGIRSAPGVAGFGYQKWIVQPLALDFGLKSVKAAVPTPGGTLSVCLEESSSALAVVIDAPKGTSGSFVLGKVNMTLTGKTSYSFSVKLSSI